MRYETAARFALGYLAVTSAVLGLWAVLAPKSLFDDFPGLGRAWLATDGPYNEHLVRDVGALNLALAVLLAVALVTLTRHMVRTAAAASVAWGLPHLIYHVFNPPGDGSSDAIAGLIGLVLFVALPVVLYAFTPAVADETS